MKSYLAPLLFLALAACGKPAPSAAPLVLAPLADPVLAKIFDSSCKTCHTVKASGAPLAGDAAAWAPRLVQGKETLLNHTIGGHLAMPPMGLCPQCSEEQFTALIEYMSASPLK